MMKQDRALTLADWILRAAIFTIFASALGFAVAFLLSFVGSGALAARLVGKYGTEIDTGSIMFGLRAILLLGIAGIYPLYRIFSELRSILATVRQGDPFLAENGARLNRVGWALLALQFMDLLFGASVGYFSSLKVEVIDWTPALGGWIAVPLVFILARVFQIGAQMRDDLATTV